MPPGVDPEGRRVGAAPTTAAPTTSAAPTSAAPTSAATTRDHDGWADEGDEQECWSSVTAEADRASAEHDEWLHSDHTLSEEHDEADALASGGRQTPQRAGDNGASVAAAAMALVLALALSPKSGTYGWLMLLSALAAALATATGSVPLAVIAFRTARRPVAGNVHDARRRSWFRPFVSKKLYSHLEEVTRDGVSLHYTGPRDLRRETPPLASGSDNSQAFWQKTWELIRDGRVFAFTRVEARKHPIVSSPIGATPKRDSNGAETGKWRFFHHLSKWWQGVCVNDMSSSERHGPIPLPTHRQVIRRILAFRAMCGPLIPILLKKEDVDGAFTLIDVKAEDVPIIATDMGFKSGDLGADETPVDVETLIDDSVSPGVASALRSAGAAAAACMRRTTAAAKNTARNQRGRGAKVRAAAAATSLFTLTYLTGTFGHLGMPAQFGRMASTPIGNYFDGHVAAVPEINGPWPFSCYVYVDDAVDVCPDVGVRRWLAEYTLLSGMLLALGPGSYNAEKGAMDGLYETTKVIWGIGYDTVRHVLFISKERVGRAQKKLWEPEFDWGRRDVSMKQLQSLYGVIRNLGEVYTPLREHYKAISNMMCTADPERLRVVPRGDAEQQLRAWTRFWRALENLRILFSDEALVQSNYLTTFAGALSARERLSMPGERARRVYFGSDATPRTVGITDFATGRVGVLVWTTTLEAAVRNAVLLSGCPPESLGDMIIAVKELAGVLLAVAAFGGAHQDALIVQPCDNQNAVAWLEHRRADNEYVQAMLDMIGRLEVAYKVQLYVPYINTHRNKWNDLLTRPEVDGVALEAELPVGPTEVGVHEATYRWVDDMLENEKLGMRRVGIEELARFYLTRPGTSRRLHHEADGCVADRLAANREAVGAPEIDPDAVRKLQIGMVENCAGVGQVSSAAAELGVELLRLVEHDETCQWLLKKRHPEAVVLSDVLDPAWYLGLSAAEKRRLVIVFGGYPCQGYSAANRGRRGAEDPRSWLLLEALKVLSQPDLNYNQRGRLLVFAGENVVDKEELAGGPDSLLQKERAYAQLHGYGRSSLRVRAVDFGDAQHRVRLVETFEPFEMLDCLGEIGLPPTRPNAAAVVKDVVLTPERRGAGCWVDQWRDKSEYIAELGPDLGVGMPRRAGHLVLQNRRYPVWSINHPGWTVKTTGEWPRGAGGAFYYDDRVGRVFILEADDVWRMQGLPVTMLTTWRAAHGANMFDTPAPTEAAVKRVGGNSITTGTAAMVARHVLVGRAAAFLTARPYKRRRARGQQRIPSELSPRPPTESDNPHEPTKPPSESGAVGSSWRAGGGGTASP